MATTQEAERAGQDVFDRLLSNSEKRMFRGGVAQLESLANSLLPNPEISQADFNRLGQMIIDIAQLGPSLLGKALDANSRESMLFYLREQIKKAIEPLLNANKMVQNPTANVRQIPLRVLAPHRYFEERVRASSSRTFEQYMVLSNSDAARKSDLFHRDAESFHEAGYDRAAPTSVTLTDAEVRGLKKLVTRGNWINPDILTRALQRISYYQGNPPVSLPEQLGIMFQELQERLDLEDFRSNYVRKKYGGITEARANEIRRAVAQIVELNNKLIQRHETYAQDKDYADPIFEGWKDSIESMRVNGVRLDTYLQQIQGRIEPPESETYVDGYDKDGRPIHRRRYKTDKEGRIIRRTNLTAAEFEQLGLLLMDLDQKRRNVDNGGIVYADDQGDGYNEELKGKQRIFLDDLMSEIRGIRSAIATNVDVSGKNASTDVEGRPGPDATVADWRKFYRGFEAPEHADFLKQEMKEVVEGMLAAGKRSTTFNGEPNTIYYRYEGLNGIFGEIAGNNLITDAAFKEQCKYFSKYMRCRRLLYDMDLVHAQSRSMTCNVDGLGPEAGMGFKQDIIDFFVDEVDPNDPEVGFKDSDKVMEAFAIMQELINEDDEFFRNPANGKKERVVDPRDGHLKGEFKGTNFKEDGGSQAKIQETVKKRMGSNPDNEEAIGIAFSIASIVAIRVHYFEYLYMLGASPQGKVGEWVKLIKEGNPFAGQLYNAYKRLQAIPLMEALALTKDWWNERKSRSDTDRDKVLRRAATGVVGKRFSLQRLLLLGGQVHELLTGHSHRVNLDVGALQKRKDDDDKGFYVDVPVRARNIEKSEFGTLQQLRTIATLRKRYALPSYGPQDDPNRELRNPYPDFLEFMIIRRAERKDSRRTIEDWIEGRGRFVAFNETALGPVASAKDYTKGFSNGNDFRQALVGEGGLADLLNIRISQLKALNELVDWNYVGAVTLAYIDKMFRAYAQFDEEGGANELYKLTRSIIEESVGLKSAGDILLEGDSGLKLLSVCVPNPYNPDAYVNDGTGIGKFVLDRNNPLNWNAAHTVFNPLHLPTSYRQVKLKDYLLNSIQLTPLHPAQAERRRPNMQGPYLSDNKENKYPMGKVISGKAIQVARYALYRMRNKTFHKTTAPLGQAAAKQKESVDDTKK